MFARTQESSPVTATVANSVLETSVATARAPQGGGLTAFFATVSLSNATVRNNSVVMNAPELGPFDVLSELVPFGSGAGGGLFLYSTALTVDRGSAISGNAATSGGGVFLSGAASRATIASSRVALNTATSSNGGGLYLDGAASLAATDAAVDGNTAQDSGGGVYASAVKALSVSGMTATGNR